MSARQAQAATPIAPKPKQTEEEAVAAASDAELLSGIKKMGNELARRRAAALEARRSRTYAICIDCGNPFTRKQYEELERCPVCGDRRAIVIREDTTVDQG